MSEKVQQQRQAKLVAGLKELGTGQNKIAEALKAKKIKGIVGDSNDCPVAMYVKKLFPKAECVEVDASGVSVDFADGTQIQCKLSKALETFIGNFDEEKYDFLVKAE